MSDFIRVVNMIPNNSSGETNQDSEPNLAVNPANAQEIAGTAFTPSPNLGSPNSPIFYSSDGGDTWVLKDFIAGTPACSGDPEASPRSISIFCVRPTLPARH